jgi:hypothetical protein
VFDTVSIAWRDIENKENQYDTKHVARRQDQTFADWFAELRDLPGERWADVADQAPTIYAVWCGGATPAQALYMVGLILPPKAAA